MKWLKDVLGVAIDWNFFEPGEAKSICDQHFAVVSGACRRFVGTGRVIMGVEDVQRIIENLGNTTVCLNDIDRAHEQSEYMTYMRTSMPSSKSF